MREIASEEEGAEPVHDGDADASDAGDSGDEADEDGGPTVGGNDDSDDDDSIGGTTLVLGAGSDVAPVDDVLASDDASDGDAKSEIPDGSSAGEAEDSHSSPFSQLVKFPLFLKSFNASFLFTSQIKISNKVDTLST